MSEPMQSREELLRQAKAVEELIEEMKTWPQIDVPKVINDGKRLALLVEDYYQEFLAEPVKFRPEEIHTIITIRTKLINEGWIKTPAERDSFPNNIPWNNE